MGSSDLTSKSFRRAPLSTAPAPTWVRNSVSVSGLEDLESVTGTTPDCSAFAIFVWGTNGVQSIVIVFAAILTAGASVEWDLNKSMLKYFDCQLLRIISGVILIWVGLLKTAKIVDIISKLI